MADEHFTTGSEENKPQDPSAEAITQVCEECGEEMKARPGKTIGYVCEKIQMRAEKEEEIKKQEEAIKQKIVMENTYSIGLVDLLLDTTHNLQSFCKILDIGGPECEEYDQIFQVLKPLIECQHATLEKIGVFIFNAIGDIQILVCNEVMQVDGKSYREGEFYKAELKPKEAPPLPRLYKLAESPA